MKLNINQHIALIKWFVYEVITIILVSKIIDTITTQGASE